MGLDFTPECWVDFISFGTLSENFISTRRNDELLTSNTEPVNKILKYSKMNYHLFSMIGAKDKELSQNSCNEVE